MTSRLAIILLLFAVIVCTGCAPALADARAAVNRISDLYAATEPALERQRIAAGDACFAASPPGDPAVVPCIEAVRARWKPIEAAVAAVYAALVAAQGAVGAAEAGAALGRAPSLPRVLVAVEQAIDAAVELQEALIVAR